MGPNQPWADGEQAAEKLDGFAIVAGVDLMGYAYVNRAVLYMRRLVHVNSQNTLTSEFIDRAMALRAVRFCMRLATVAR